MQMKAYKMFFNLALGRIENVYKRQIDMRPNISETFIEKKDKPFWMQRWIHRHGAGSKSVYE